MNDIKNRTLLESNIREINKFFHYVNYVDKLITIGFSSKAALLKNSSKLLFNSDSLLLMENRFKRINI